MDRIPDHRDTTSAVVSEYRRLAQEYDSRWSRYIAHSTAATFRRMSLPAAARVLDIGCGTGALLAQIAVARPDVDCTGIDLSPEMLAIAARRLAGVQLIRASAENLPFADGSFDVVCSCSMFHFVTDPLNMLREARRVLKPSGQLVITDWCHDYLTCRLCDVYLRFASRAHRPIHGTSECRHFLENTGFRGISIDRYRISWLWGMMTAVAMA